MLQMIVCTAQEFCDMYDYTREEVAEWYGEEADKFYWIFTEAGEDGSLIGVRFKNGTFAVYGCRRDTEGLTYEQMTNRLFAEFDK